MGKVEIYQTRTGFRYRIKDANGVTLVTSETHGSQDEAASALGKLKDLLGKYWTDLEFVSATE